MYRLLSMRHLFTQRAPRSHPIPCMHVPLMRFSCVMLPGLHASAEERLIGWMGERPQGLAAEEILDLVPDSTTGGASQSADGKGQMHKPW